jgi:hypothetical protein
MKPFRLWTRISSVALLTMLLAIAAQAQSQDSPPPDLQQLNEKLQQLERGMQVLRGQINAVEQSQKPPGAAANVSPYTAAASQPAAAPPAEGAEKAKGKSSLDIYGYVMLDSGYDFKQVDPNWFDVVRPTKLPSSPNQFGGDGNTYFGVRQTRFGVKSSTPTKYGDLNTLFEFELFGTGVDAGQTTFRLRHAYGELGQFGAGQTWSPFMDIDVFPNSVEYWGPNGMVFFRNVQVRWMPIRDDRTEVIIALERPGASADAGTYADRIELQGIKPRFNFPDFSGHVRIKRDWGYVQLAGIVRKIGWVDTNNDPVNLGGSVVGWGLSLSSNLNFSKKDVGRFEVVYGQGVENYMNDAPVDVAIRNNFGNPNNPTDAVPLPILGVVSFLDHTWSDRFSTSIGYSLLNIYNANAQLPSDFHQGQYALVNLLYHPVKKVTIASEFQFGRRINFSDGFNVNDYRMQFSFRYDWAKGFAF